MAGCRSLNMVVMARTDPHADVYDTHPDWIAVDAEGKKRRHWAMPELWVTCALGHYNFELMTQVTKTTKSSRSIYDGRQAADEVLHPLDRVYRYKKEISTMSKLSLLFVAAPALLLPFGSAAADISGKWKAEFTTSDGTQRTNTFTLKADGAKLTGTVAGSQDETPIQNGTVSGDEISFTAERPFGKFTYKGRVTGNEIKFKVEFNEQSFEIIAKRVSS